MVCEADRNPDGKHSSQAQETGARTPQSQNHRPVGSAADSDEIRGRTPGDLAGPALGGSEVTFAGRMAGDSPVVRRRSCEARGGSTDAGWEGRERKVGLSLAGLLRAFNRIVTDICVRRCWKLSLSSTEGKLRLRDTAREAQWLPIFTLAATPSTGGSGGPGRTQPPNSRKSKVGPLNGSVFQSWRMIC